VCPSRGQQRENASRHDRLRQVIRNHSLTAGSDELPTALRRLEDLDLLGAATRGRGTTLAFVGIRREPPLQATRWNSSIKTGADLTVKSCFYK
jgi:hypothetical protein